MASRKNLERLIIWTFSCFAKLLIFDFIQEQFWVLRHPSLLQNKQKFRHSRKLGPPHSHYFFTPFLFVSCSLFKKENEAQIKQQ